MKRKTKLLLALGVVALIAATAAWAYYGGSGASAATQAASAGSAPRSVTVTVNTGGATIYPGESASFDGAISLVGNGRAHVGSVTAAIDAASLPAGCSASWFSASADLTGGPQNIDSGNPAAFSGLLSFSDENVLQDACSDASLKVVVTANPTP